MPETLWLQDYFGKGELSPLMYSRVTVNAYYQALMTAKNVLCFPQGAAGKRFGTDLVKQLTSVSDYTTVLFKAFQYLDECTYLLVFYNDTVDIYLEDYQVAHYTGTGIAAAQVPLIDYTVLDNVFRTCTGLTAPYDLTRSADAANAITGFSGANDTLTITSAVSASGIWPAQFTTASALPTTSPQIHTKKTYFVRAITTTTVRIYATSQDASNNENYFEVSAAGTSSNVVIQNTWGFAAVSFSNKPTFDFQDVDYSGFTFSSGANTGYGITVTSSGNVFTSGHVGGLVSGNGGIARIKTFTDAKNVVVDIIEDFTSLMAGGVPGSLMLITEPAWSDDRGWPRKCSSYQSRAVFANSDVLPNGLWLSAIRSYKDFDDSSNDDDYAISHYPTSDTVNYINFIVPYRSLTVHTNSAIFSTPLGVETAITPQNFYMTEQDSTPADVVQPRAIDNQLIILAGNDVYSLLWDGFNAAYSSDNISVVNEHLITGPIDEAPYVDKTRAGSRYMFIVNEDGSLAIFQTLIGQDVAGFTSAYGEQPYGNAYFRGVTSDTNGRAWFLVEREIAGAISAASLSTYTPTPPATGTDVFPATGHGMTADIVTAIKFATTGTLLTSTPQIAEDTYYWAVAIDADTFYCYTTQADADADENRIEVNEIPANNTVEPWPLTTTLFIEELNLDTQLDCAGYYDSTATSSISGQTRFNAQAIKMQGDGYGFQTTVVGGEVDFIAHGEAVEVETAQYGFPINVQITPLPLALPTSSNPKTAALVEPKHIRVITLGFADTIGGTITQGGNTFPIAPKRFNSVDFGTPPTEFTGIFTLGSYGGWDDYNIPSFTINHDDPFGFKLTSIFYKVDY